MTCDSALLTDYPRRRNRRNVTIVNDALLKMAALNPTEQSLVQAEITRMSNPEFRPESDRRGTGAEEAGALTSCT